METLTATGGLTEAGMLILRSVFDLSFVFVVSQIWGSRLRRLWSSLEPCHVLQGSANTIGRDETFKLQAYDEMVI